MEGRGDRRVRVVVEARVYDVEGGRRVMVWDVVCPVYLMSWAGCWGCGGGMVCRRVCTCARGEWIGLCA